MGVLVVDPEQTPTAGTVLVTPRRFLREKARSHKDCAMPVGSGLLENAVEHSPQNPELLPSPEQSNSSTTHTKLGIFQKNQYAAPHICASTRPAAQIAPTRQMTFSPSPTAGRKIRVYVLKAGAVYQK